MTKQKKHKHKFETLKILRVSASVPVMLYTSSRCKCGEWGNYEYSNWGKKPHAA